jgi:hypothetical protein
VRRWLCYSAAVPLGVYAGLLALDVIERTDASVVVLFFVECAAVVLTVRASLERYRTWFAGTDRATATIDPAEAVYPMVDRRGAGPKLYDADRHPRQRATDRGWRYWLPWLYRHVGTAAAIIIAAFAVAAAVRATNQANANARDARELSAANRRAVVAIQEGRRAAIRDSCRQDEAIADVLRRTLLGFGVGRPGNPAPPGVREAFRPLGGLRPLPAKAQARRCDARVRHGGP